MGLKDPFIGTVDLQTGEIGDDFAYYFAVSEQIPSAVGVGVLVNPDAHVESAGGWIVQIMPDATEEEICAVEKAVGSIRPVSSLLKEGMSPEEMIRLIVPDYVSLQTNDIQWKCYCSREKCENVLYGLRMRDLLEIIEEDEQADINCEFCGANYHFTKEDLQRIYNDRVRDIAEKLEQSAKNHGE